RKVKENSLFPFVKSSTLKVEFLLLANFDCYLKFSDQNQIGCSLAEISRGRQRNRETVWKKKKKKKKRKKMAYVDHAFSITDEDIMMETSYTVNNRPPIKEIALAISLLIFGTLGIIVGFLMAFNHVGGDRAHGLFFAILGSILFIPGFYYTRIAYYAYKGYKGFSFSNIPAV
ncbi:hypothetical protein F2P56_017754, partial [Juglans regia]